jgi:hypothetical protein
MKCSRVVVAVLALVSLASMANANTILTLEKTNFGSIAGFITYGMSANSLESSYSYLSPVYFVYATYDISSVLSALEADPNAVIVSAKLIYSRAYTAAPSTQSTWTVVRATMDYTLDVGTDYTSAYHMTFIGGSRATPQLMGTDTCSQAEVVNDPNSIYGPYAGTQSVDITTIVTAWANGATNYGLGITSSVLEKIRFMPYFPRIEVEIASVPEPMTMGLLAVGGIATLLRRRRIA